MLSVEAKKGEQAKEWGIKPGETLDYDYYYKMNEHHQKQAMAQLLRLAKEDKPFYLNYWPQYPVDFNGHDKKIKTPNGGTWVSRMQELALGWRSLIDMCYCIMDRSV